MKRLPLLVVGALALAFVSCEKHPASVITLLEPHHGGGHGGGHAEHHSEKHAGQHDAESHEPADAKPAKEAHEQRESGRIVPEARH